MTNSRTVLSVLPLALILGLFVPLEASAVLVSYDYEFDTPVFFSDPLWAPVLAILAGGGPTITGSISFDTDDSMVFGSTTDLYLRPPQPMNTFSHSGELDTLGFFEHAAMFRTRQDTAVPYYLGDWKIFLGDSIFSFYLWFPGAINVSGRANISCYDLGKPGSNTDCHGIDFDFDVEDFTNFSLVRTDATPISEPTTTALLAIGLVGAGFARRRRIH